LRRRLGGSSGIGQTSFLSRFHGSKNCAASVECSALAWQGKQAVGCTLPLRLWRRHTVQCKTPQHRLMS
jgi:hypothetical protein